MVPFRNITRFAGGLPVPYSRCACESCGGGGGGAQPVIFGSGGGVSHGGSSTQTDSGTTQKNSNLTHYGKGSLCAFFFYDAERKEKHRTSHATPRGRRRRLPLTPGLLAVLLETLKYHVFFWLQQNTTLHRNSAERKH